MTSTQKLVLCVIAMVDLFERDRERRLHGYEFDEELERLKTSLCTVAEELEALNKSDQRTI